MKNTQKKKETPVRQLIKQLIGWEVESETLWESKKKEREQKHQILLKSCNDWGNWKRQETGFSSRICFLLRVYLEEHQMQDYKFDSKKPNFTNWVVTINNKGSIKI